MKKKPKQPKDMSVLFSASKGTLAQIATKTNSLTVIADIVRQICPDVPEDVWQIANFKQNILVIEVNSSVWGQRLQFERMNICRALEKETSGVFSQIEIKVSPYRNKVPVKKAQPIDNTAYKQAISPKTSAHLREIAKGAPKNLQETLERLAKLGDKN